MRAAKRCVGRYKKLQGLAIKIWLTLFWLAS